MTGKSRSHLRSVPPPEETEDDLVPLAREGDQRAVAALFRLHSHYIAAVAFRILGSSAEVDDVVQDTFVAGVRNLSQLEEPQKLRSWLVTIATRQANRRIAQRIKRRSLTQELGARLTETVGNSAAEVDELFDALERLDPELRVPWTLVRIQGLQLQEAAEACAVSLATLKRRVGLADKRVRRRLGL